MVISPDGSARDNGAVQMTTEIKCSIPGKTYTTDVHYDIPD